MNFYIAAPFGNYIKTKNTRSVIGTFTLERRTGLIIQLIKTLRYKDGVWYNALGLRNPGVKFGLKYYHRNKKDILSLAAIEPEDWMKLSKIVPSDIDLEINISCPNIDHFDNYTKGIENFISPNRKVIAKLAPNTEIATVDKLLEKGFSSFHCCNTLPTTDGGMSGRRLRPYVINLCTVIKTLSKSAEIIAGGGIYEFNDITHYKNFGATGFSLGTVCFNPVKFYSLIKEINGLQNIRS